MNLTLWIITGLLAVVALTGGISKTFVPKEKLAHVAGGGWTNDHTARFVKTLGVLELLAVVGLILPAVVDAAPVLVPITAVCWVLLMVGAMITHFAVASTDLSCSTSSTSRSRYSSRGAGSARCPSAEHRQYGNAPEHSRCRSVWSRTSTLRWCDP